MATVFNNQRRLGIVLVPDGTLIYNNQPVIGIADAGGVLMVGNLMTLGVDILNVNPVIYNEQGVRGAVLITDGRKIYNNTRVIPYTTQAALSTIQNVASRGYTPNISATPSGVKTRYKAQYRFTLGLGGSKSLAPVFNNKWLNNAILREVTPSGKYTIRKASILFDGVVVPLFFNGSRSVDVLPGTVDLKPTALLPAQFGRSDNFPPLYSFFVKLTVDIPAGQNVAAQNPMYLNGEGCCAYDPAYDVDDIDTVNFSIPASADQWIAFPGPTMVVGDPLSPMTAVAGVSDSIGDGSNDNSGDGSSGGGWMRRSTFAANLPYLGVTRTGDKAQFVAGDNAMSKAMLKYCHAAVVQLGNNDIRDGVTQANFLTYIRSVWNMLRSAGIQRIIQALQLAETSSTNQGSTIAGQTIVPAFAAGGIRDNLNAIYQNLDGGTIDDFIDIPSAVQSLGKWNVPVFTTTLSEAAVAWSGSVKTVIAPEVGEFLVYDPNTPANQDVVYTHVSAVSGSGPYTDAVTVGPTKAHAAGVKVAASLSAEGIHPQVKSHIAIASKAAPAMQRAKGLKTPWLNTAKSFEIDFVNRRAQQDGVIVPIATLASCLRPSVGTAFDGQSWFDLAADTLRYVDGGGLHYEPAATNYQKNSNAIGGTPAAGPTGWNMNTATGLTYADFSYGVENGINFCDVHMQMTAAATGTTLDIAPGVVTAVGDVWTHSAYLAIFGVQMASLTSIALGLRTGDASGTGIEFTGNLNVQNSLSRKMSRQTLAGLAIADARSVSVSQRISVNKNTSAALDFTLRIASPQFEKTTQPSSLIRTTGLAATRAADAVTIALPQGTHTVTVTYSTGATAVYTGVSGNWPLPISDNAARNVINTISAVRTA